MAECEDTDRGITVLEALSLLDPPIPRRTLERRLADHCTPLPVKRRPKGRGRPAAVYEPDDVYREHHEWANSQIGKRNHPGGDMPTEPTPTSGSPTSERQSGPVSDVNRTRIRGAVKRTVPGPAEHQLADLHAQFTTDLAGGEDYE